jgi:Bacterial PH domain
MFGAITADRAFAAPYDSTTKVVSAAVVVLFLVLTAVTRVWIVGVLGAFVVAASYAWSPRAYAVSGRAILVRRLVGYTCVPLSDLREVRAATAEDLSGAIRIFGSGGVFGYCGIFRTSKLGKSTWYVTDRKQAVVVITVGLIGTVLLYSPGPPRATLTRDRLAIHDRFYPVTVQASAVEVDRIRVVDLAVEKDWRPTRRTNGFANSHYVSGWFRVANGKTVRLYRAGGTRMVLLPPKGDGTPVLLEVPNAEEFIRELQGKWGRREPN